MIRSIEITRFRGIRQGKLEDLTPLVILVGPNGCGKSTVLDAMLIGASPSVGDGVGWAVVRHQGVKLGVRWLLWNSGEHGNPEVKIWTRDDSRRICRLQFIPGNPSHVQCGVELQTQDGKKQSSVTSADIHPPRFGRQGPLLPFPQIPDVRLVERPGAPGQKPLHERFTDCVQRGLRNEARAAVAELLPEVKDILILTEEDSPILHLEFAKGSVPVALAGDGVYQLVGASLELISFPGGVVLFEEPELHQHPGAICHTVRAILAAVRRGIQVIISTHSLELIDLVLAEASEDDLAKLSLYRMELENGLLISHRLPGEKVARARLEIVKDLR